MTTTRILILCLLAWAPPTALHAADGDPYNLRAIQRGPDGIPVPLDYKGTDYPLQALGFAANGLYAPLTISQLLTDGSVTTAKLASGAITDIKIAPGANIALSKLATDPLARANHTGTQSADSLTDGATNKAFLASERTKLAGIASGATANSPDATLLARGNHTGTQDVSTVVGAGTTKSGTQASPTTTNPLSPTWTTQDYIVYYGATGTINLPAAASYANKTFIVISTGTFTVTVAPNGSDHIVVSGASLGAGVANVLSATAGASYAYVCDGVRWNRLAGAGGSSGASAWADITSKPTTLTGFGITDGQPLNANLTTLSGISLTAFGQAGLSYQGPGSFSGTGTYFAGGIYSGDMTAAASLTMSLTAGQKVVYLLNTTGGPHLLSFTSARRGGTTGSTISTLSVPNGFQILTFYHDGTNLWIFPDIYELLNLAADVTGTLGVANGGTGITSFATGIATWLGTSTSANLRAALPDESGTGAAIFGGGDIGAGTAATASAGDNDTSIATTAFVQTEVDATKSGSHASPSTTNPLSPTWSGPLHAIWYGATGQINLPAATGYAERGILIYNTGAFTITMDPSGSEVVVRDGIVQSAGVSFTLSSGAGNYVALISDGTRWVTLGYKGTLAEGS